MLKVEKNQTGQKLTARLSGAIEESVRFQEKIGTPFPEMDIYCKEISRINSIGVKAWIQYFQQCKSKGSHLRFFECSLAIVEQFNFISNFHCGGSIESVYVPFSCTHCHLELIGLYKTLDLKKMNFKIPSLKCSKCGGQAIFDDIEEEFFQFLTRP